jgi:peptidoglycan-associated lipoprotein
VSANLQPRTLIALPLLAALAFATGCPKKTADLELDAARAAMDEARKKKANDCAQETYQAAEAAIAEAKRLAEAGEIEDAKKKAGEAKALAEQAAAASRPGCDEKKAASDEGPKPKVTDATSANMSVKLGEAVSTIYFDYNDATIREDSKAVLSRVAEIMSKDEKLKIEVEGHCDVRGSTEYNLHLGERRARSVVKYLVAQGVEPKQVEVISYGEERPVDLGMTEEAHQQNRRAELKPQ